MISKIQLQQAFQESYNQILFAKDVLKPVFGEAFGFFSKAIEATDSLTATEAKVIEKVLVYGNIALEDGTDAKCYEITLQPHVRIEYSKIAIQRYVRKLLTSGQAALVNFISPTYPNTWRLTLVAKDSVLTETGVKEKTTHPKRYTFLLGPAESCRTAAERFQNLSMEQEITLATLVKAFSVERLSKSFFDEYRLHYSKIVKYLQESNFCQSAFANNDKAIRDYTKKLLGRLVFLYFVQKKGWLGASDLDYKDGDLDFLANLFHTSGGDESFYPNWLRTLFFETLNNKRPNDDFKLPSGKSVKIPFLNGGLFDKEEFDEFPYVFAPALFHNPENNENPNQRGFFDFLGAYNFTVHEDSPDDHTVAVDPEMLGHIFENLLEDNKDKGAFYTPKEIVHFMCQESLIEYLLSHLGKQFKLYKTIDGQQVQLISQDGTEQLLNIDKISNGLDYEAVEHIILDKDPNGLNQTQLRTINKLLDSVKICDPAIGSGAFPMGLLQEIFSAKELIAYELDDKWEPDVVKANIIQNSIYGVDIEKGAVDIARLRFWLSLVVDENKPHPLPNLDYKIVSGDSLVSKYGDEVIEIDWGIDTTKNGFFGQELLLKKIDLLKQISEKQRQYFLPENINKKALAAEIRSLKIDLLANQFKLMVETKGNDVPASGAGKKAKEQMLLYTETQGWKRNIEKLQQLKQQPDKPFLHFDWKLDFPEILNPNLAQNPGFDIVIGNPPYIQLQKLGAYADILEKAHFSTFERTGDIYGLFYELGVSLLKNNGILSFITSNKWMRAGYGVSLRKFFSEKTNPLRLIDFGGIQVFDTATVDTNILVLQKASNKNQTKTCLLSKNFQSQKKLSVFVRQHGSISDFNTSDSWVVLSPIEKRIKEKIERVGTPLKNWDVQINYGIKTGFNEAFIITGDKRKELIEQDPKSEEIIRPILRGRDIKRYSYEFADLYLIATFPSLKIDIDRYPAVKEHLLSFGYERLKQTGEPGARKKTNNKWYETQDSISYWEDFYKQKMVWKRVGSILKFGFDVDGHYTLDSTCFATGIHVPFLIVLLNTPIGAYLLKDSPKTGTGDLLISVQAIEPILVPLNYLSFDHFDEKKLLEYLNKPDLNNELKIRRYIYELYELSQSEIEFIENRIDTNNR